MNKITGKTLTRADLDKGKNPGTEYLVICFPYIDDEMLFKVITWAVANRYRVASWNMSAGVTGELVILSMTLEVIE
jgi:hypothetical protein